METREGGAVTAELTAEEVVGAERELAAMWDGVLCKFLDRETRRLDALMRGELDEG